MTTNEQLIRVTKRLREINKIICCLQNQAGGLEGITGALVNNTDPLNPIINSPQVIDSFDAGSAVVNAPDYIMLGKGGSTQITPSSTGRLLIFVSGSATIPADGGIIVGLRYGTGSPPSFGSVDTGTLIGGPRRFQLTASGATTNSGETIYSFSSFITGLTIGTQYWIDLAVQSMSGANVNFNTTQILVVEI